MIRFVPMRLHHIDWVLGDLWDRGIAEAMVFGARDVDDLHDYARNRLSDKHAYAAIADDSPIAIFGAFPDEILPDLYTTWFMATDGFIKHYRALTRELRRLIDVAGKQEGCRVLQTLSACTHPLSEKWFGVLGFKQDSDFMIENGGRLKRFAREFLCA